MKNKILNKWTKLSESDVESISGRFNLLSEKIQKVYQCSFEKAISECNDFRNANKIA
jgi:hypothetical protein